MKIYLKPWMSIAFFVLANLLAITCGFYISDATGNPSWGRAISGALSALIFAIYGATYLLTESYQERDDEES